MPGPLPLRRLCCVFCPLHDAKCSANGTGCATQSGNPTARTVITNSPADVANPGTSNLGTGNLDVRAGAPPTPDAANIPRSDHGQFKVVNNLGTAVARAARDPA